MAFTGNASTKIHGMGGAIYVGGTWSSKTVIPAGAIRIAAKSEWSLQRNRDYVDSTSFGDTNKTYLAGLPNVQGNFSGFLDASGDLLLNAASSGAQLITLFASDGTGAGATNGVVMVAHGPAFMDASITTSLSDAVKITGEFRASAGWTIDLDGVTA
jgi:hypothetical protein